MNQTQTAAAGGPVLLASAENGVARLVMNRPERLNALNGELASALDKAFERIARDPSVRVVLLTGAGRAFCAGGDLTDIGAAREDLDFQRLEPILRAGMSAVLRMATLPQPVIAAVNGPAAGAGMNLALAADLRVAAEEASFGQNFARVGLFPDYGGTYFLPRLAGPAKAAELFYTGEMIDARTALGLGLVNRVVPGRELEAEAGALAARLAAGPPLAVRAVKQTLFGSDREALERALEAEAAQQKICFASEDCREGIRAFFAKRAPSFTGR